MKQLLLLRHAKSSWDDPRLDDHDRPLNARGREAAPRMGSYLAREGLQPDLVLCSTAVRTVETLDLVAPHLGRRRSIRYERDLYMAEWTSLLARVQWVADDVRRLLLVGHNPGLERLAVALSVAPRGDGHAAQALSQMAEKFPTGALAVIDFPVSSWRDIRPGLGRLVAFVRPRDL